RRQGARQVPSLDGEGFVGQLQTAGGEQVELAAAFLRVLLADGLGGGAVVALDRSEGLIGDAGGDQRRGGAEQGVADPDVGVQERQRLAWLHGLQPQRYLGQLGGHLIDVHAV